MKMTAAVVRKPRVAELERQRRPDPGRGDVRVRLQGCGVCGSNLPVWEGRPWFQYPLSAGEPGHEGWGWVDAVGSDVDELRAGDRVAMISCRAFADHELCSASHVVRLPRELDGRPFPGEPLGCAMNIFRRSDIGRGHWVGVVGLGFLGLLLVGLAARAGARVIAVGRRPIGEAMALQMGAERAVRPGDPNRAVAEIFEMTGGEGCERVIEATGEQEPLNLASELCRERGRLIIAGYHQDGLRKVNMQSWNCRGLDVINAHERDPKVYLEGVRAAVAAVIAGGLDPSPLYTHRGAFMG